MANKEELKSLAHMVNKEELKKLFNEILSGIDNGEITDSKDYRLTALAYNLGLAIGLKNKINGKKWQA